MNDISYVSRASRTAFADDRPHLARVIAPAGPSLLFRAASRLGLRRQPAPAAAAG
jgi:hypothetical protein